MPNTKVLVRQPDGNTREVEIVDGGKLSLQENEQLVIAASPDQAEVKSGDQGQISIRLEGLGEFTVESALEPPEIVAMNLDEAPAFRAQPRIVFEKAGSGAENDALTHEPLGVHQASVGDTGFLDQNVGEDFGIGQALDMAEFSAKAGRGLPMTRVASDVASDQGVLGLADFDSGSSNPAVLNDPPVIVLNETLLVPDGQSASLNGSLKSVDERTPRDGNSAILSSRRQSMANSCLTASPSRISPRRPSPSPTSTPVALASVSTPRPPARPYRCWRTIISFSRSATDN